ncbi:hypothetical protein F5879DRAFT_673088 [Lentinula edodes]|nr:hypothetical protein F5879DRAFT_673088 [Lentinula edodes]
MVRRISTILSRSSKCIREVLFVPLALLASLAYPYFSKTQLRAGADLMNVFFVFDEYTDVENEIVVAQLGIEIMDGLRNPHKCCNIKGGSILRKMAAE